LSVLLTSTHNTLIVVAIPQALHLNDERLAKLTSAAPRWVAGALVILLGARAAMMVTELASKPNQPGGSDVAPVAVPTVDVPSILRANLFGQATVLATGTNAPVTSLALVLVGVLANQDPQQGYAILGPSAAAVKLYTVGNPLPGGARLHSVYPDRVLVDRGGSVEALMLPRQSTVSGPAPAPAPLAAATIDRVQQLVRDNPGIIGEIMRPQAVLVEGRQRGYRVYPGPNQQAFSRLGLRAGDLVIAINGTTLDDPSRGGEVFGTLGSVAEARVTVVRNGSQQDLVLNLADVAAEAERVSQPPAVQLTNPIVGEGVSPAAAR
jgi:general secretion pathway protein C